MNKYEKETEKLALKSEKELLNKLKGTYANALNDIKKKIEKLDNDLKELIKANPDNESLIRSKVYQLNYQKAMEDELTSILELIAENNVNSTRFFLTKRYKESFLSINYHLQQRGIPVIMPINNRMISKVVNTPTNKLKFSDRLYKNSKDFKKTILAEISRGLATGSSYKDIARNVSNVTQVDFYKAYRIARTESGRISTTAKLEAMKDAKKRGADIVKQWDATLDSKTRKTHRKLDGQWVELDEYFKVDGKKTKGPGKFGEPEEDINCRCVLLSVPRWDLEDEVVKYDDENNQLIKSSNYQTWEKGYYKFLEKNKKIKNVVTVAEKRIELYKKGYSVKEVDQILKEGKK